MATREEWTRLINLSHDLALVEDDLRNAVKTNASSNEAYDAGVQWLAETILFERFGVDV